MSISPESQNRPLDPWTQALEKSLSKPVEDPDVELNRVRTARDSQRALEIDARIISGVSDPEDIANSANLLATRHQEHYIAPEFVNVILRLKDNKHDSEALAKLRMLRDRANNTGFFLMNYTAEMMTNRLRLPEYVVAQSYGRHPHEEHPYHAFKVPAADCQCWLPPFDVVGESVELPDGPEDRIYGKAEKYLRNTLASCGEVKDISCTTAMNNLQLAGAARNMAFAHIKNTVNPTRGDHPINHMAASIAEISGIILPDKTRVTLLDLGHVSGIKNERSMVIHTISRRYPARHAYTLIDRTVPVEIDGQTYQIIVDWYYFIHDLRDNH